MRRWFFLVARQKSAELFMLNVLMVTLGLAYLTYFERKVIGYMHVRIGPNRVGPWGLLQPIADGLKLLLHGHYTQGEPLCLLYSHAGLPWAGCCSAHTRISTQLHARHPAPAGSRPLLAGSLKSWQTGRASYSGGENVHPCAPLKKSPHI